MQDLMMCYSEMKPCSFNTSAPPFEALHQSSRAHHPPSKQRTTALDDGRVCDLGFLPAVQELPGQSRPPQETSMKLSNVVAMPQLRSACWDLGVVKIEILPCHLQQYTPSILGKNVVLDSDTVSKT